MHLATLAKELFLDLRSPEEVSELYIQSNVKGRSKVFVAEAFREALGCVTATLKSPM